MLCITNFGDTEVANFGDTGGTNFGDAGIAKVVFVSVIAYEWRMICNRTAGNSQLISYLCSQYQLPTLMIQVIIIDDHMLFRAGVRMTFASAYPDICITGEADSGNALFALLPSTPADVILLDIHLPGGMGGAEIAKRLRREYPAMKILAVSAENTAETVETMLDAGVDGFISKQHSDFDVLAEAIRAVASGLEYYGRDIATILLGVYVAKKKTTAVTNEFTDRERDVIHLCRDGLMCKEIADRLGISINTVNTHKKNIFQKLGINNTVEMVQYALKNGIIRIEN